ncbi:MAG: PhnD/SsuA/transferrin family substrate-binding protein, partial [Chloroflexota bacterium]
MAETAVYLGQQLSINTTFIQDIPWQERAELLDQGKIDAAWLCGLYYVRQVVQPDCPYELLAAPVMADERYGDRPIYFSDVIVRRDSPYRTFADLQGCRWAYNEPNSHSGYTITCYYLATLHAPQPYFGRAVEAGSHQRAMQLVRNGEADAAAIDSTVLAIEREQDERITAELQVIASTPPSPIPPLVISKSVPASLREEIKQMLAHMHREENGCALLQKTNLKRWAIVSDSDYDPIREMATIGARITL